MYKVKIFSIGKNKAKWLDDGVEEYTRRLKPILSIEWILSKNDDQLAALLAKEENYICLDPKGIQLTSEKFSHYLQQQLLNHGSRLSFVIGGSEGIPEKIKASASSLLSLSTLTYPHQLTRIIFLEQIYRAIEIEKKSPYHK